MALPVDRRTRLPAQGRRQGHGAIGASPRPEGAAPTVHRKFYRLEGHAVHAGGVLRRGVPLRPQHGPPQLRDARHGPASVRLRACPARHAPRAVAGPERQAAPAPELEIRWENFFKTTPVQPVNVSMLIDPYLAPTLRRVPPTGKPLALLNLMRGVRLELPAGRDVATKMDAPPLSADHLLEPAGGNGRGHHREGAGADAALVLRAVRGQLAGWFARIPPRPRRGPDRGGGARRPAAGRRELVSIGEAHLGARASSARKDDFTMADLVRYAQGKTPL